MENNNHIRLLERFISNETTSEENEQLLDWFYSDDSKEQLDTLYSEKWRQSFDKPIPSDIQKKMFHQIKKSISKEEKTVFVSSTKDQIWRGFIKYAAIFILCIGVGIGSHLYTRTSLSNQTTQKEYSVNAERGQRANITLPDGSKVWLNSHTEISYSGNYGLKERTVFLTGEAYFEVAPDKNSPFVVKAEGLHVQALGTSFNIKAYKEDEEVTATLFTGKVKATAGNKEVILLPNQYVTFNRNSHKFTASHTENALYARMWLDNELSFNGQTLNEIALILNRISNVQIEFTSEKIKQYKFSGVIKNNSLDNVIEIISITAPIIYESRGDTIILSEKK